MCIFNFCRHLKMCHDPKNDKSSYIANDDLEPLLRKNGENVTINVRCKESIMHTYDNHNHDDSCSFELLAPLCRQLGYSDLRVCSNSLNTHWFTNFGWSIFFLAILSFRMIVSCLVLWYTYGWNMMKE